MANINLRKKVFNFFQLMFVKPKWPTNWYALSLVSHLKPTSLIRQLSHDVMYALFKSCLPYWT